MTTPARPLPHLREMAWPFFRGVQEATAGLVRARPWEYRLGPLLLLWFDPPLVSESEITWPIRGGLLARRQGGYLRLRSGENRIEAEVTGYRPRLSPFLHRLVQAPVHHEVTRLSLLRLRGRLPASGVPAETALRLAATAVDMGMCAMASMWLVRRGRWGLALAVPIAYHLGFWTFSGTTPAGAALGLEIVSVDGSRMSPLQAVVRLASLPAAILARRAIHDERAATDVVRTALPRPRPKAE